MGSSMVSVIMSPMNPSIEDSFYLDSTASFASNTNGVDSGWYSSLNSRCLCRDWGSEASGVVSERRSFLISISASQIVVYSVVAGMFQLRADIGRLIHD